MAMVRGWLAIKQVLGGDQAMLELEFAALVSALVLPGSAQTQQLCSHFAALLQGKTTEAGRHTLTLPTLRDGALQHHVVPMHIQDVGAVGYVP